MAYIQKKVVINNLDHPTAATDKIKAGINLLADAVKLTIGPYGKNFILEKSLKITNDGKNIAMEIQSEDETEDLALRITRTALMKVADTVGDATTTTAILIQALYGELIRLLPGKHFVGKKSLLQVRKQLSEEVKLVTDKLIAAATPIKSREELIEVAKVSVEDQKLAEMIGGTQWDLGPDGIIIAEETAHLEDSIERINGLRFDNGLGATQVINNVDKGRLEVENVPVLMTSHTLSSIKPIKPALDELLAAGRREIVIIARAFSSDTIRDIMENHKQGVKFYPINAPYVNQREVMTDLAAVLGAKFYDIEDSDLDELTGRDAGFATKVIGERYRAIFAGRDDEAATERIAKRVKELEDSQAAEPSVFMQRMTRERIAQLKGGFALLKVGALSDTERKYKFDKAEDAVNAVRSAFQEGTVKGGGLAYKEISDSLPEDSILKKSLLAPYQQIQANAGQAFEIENWVRNSVKVERVALENACEVSLNLATAGGAVSKARIKPGCHPQEVPAEEE